MTVFSGVPVDRITVEARQINLARTLLTLVGGLFFAVGWCVAKLVGLIWFAVAWSAAAVKVGWQEGRKPAAHRRA